MATGTALPVPEPEAASGSAQAASGRATRKLCYIYSPRMLRSLSRATRVLSTSTLPRYASTAGSKGDVVLLYRCVVILILVFRGIDVFS